MFSIIHFHVTRRFPENVTAVSSKMFDICLNQSREKNLTGCANATEDLAIFDKDLQIFVSILVFVLFGVIGIAGLVGNALVVLGTLNINIFHHFYFLFSP